MYRPCPCSDNPKLVEVKKEAVVKNEAGIKKEAVAKKEKEETTDAERFNLLHSSLSICVCSFPNDLYIIDVS